MHSYELVGSGQCVAVCSKVPRFHFLGAFGQSGSAAFRSKARLTPMLMVQMELPTLTGSTRVAESWPWAGSQD